MGRARIAMTGKTFGRLTVIGVAYIGETGVIFWDCVCQCGGLCVIRGGDLRAGDSSSCGCYKRDSIKMRCTTHNQCRTPEYSTWASMLQRCTNTKRKSYKDYGGRGITVCESWLKFEGFYNDMGPRPSKEHTLERNDNDGPYCKDNCRWATRREQANNKRTASLITYNGKARSMSQWAEETGIPYTTLRGRVLRGWSVEKILTTPVRTRSLESGE